MNIPTIIFLNHDHWELREEAIPHYEMLENAGIFHHSPESADLHVTNIWVDVEGWWNSANVRQAVNNFTDHYVKTLKSPVSELAKLFRLITSGDASKIG
jgi:putative transferase (TIGR04331 family)